MKPITFLFLLCLLSVTLSAQRNTLWLNGIGATSASWDKAIDAAGTEGYSFNEISTFNYEPNVNGVSGSAVQMNAEITNGGYTDVLGIGHDGGGIILRQMANAPGNRLSALILDGVPNQGSQTLKKMLPENGINQMQDLIDQVLAFKSNAQECNACRIVEAFRDWVNDVNMFSEQYAEYTPGSPVITNLGTPDIPYAIIWGNEDADDALVLSRLLGSRAQAVLEGNDTEYLECYRDEIADRRKLINDAFFDGIAQSVITAAQAVGKFLNPKLTGQGIAEGVALSLKAIHESIMAARDRDRELAELLECEMVHQALNGYWNLIVTDGYSEQTITTTIDGVSAEECCYEECYGIDYQADYAEQCYQNCVNNDWCSTPPEVITTTFFAFEPHDGLLSKSEQLLDGADAVYEAKGANHFQEQFWSQQPIKDAFVDLFDGNAGMAFEVN